MIASLRRLQARREVLVARSTLQRARLGRLLQPAARGLAAADRVAATVRAHPVLTVVAATSVVLIGPRSLLRWAVRVAPVYAFLRRM